MTRRLQCAINQGMFEQLKGFFTSLLMASITMSIGCAGLILAAHGWSRPWHQMICARCPIREIINCFFYDCFIPWIAFDVKNRLTYPLIVEINPILIAIMDKGLVTVNCINQRFRHVMNSSGEKLNNV